MGINRVAKGKTVTKATGYKALPDDIVIAVIGPTGVGKSTFINYLSRSVAKVGHNLESCTSELQPVIIPPSQHAALGGRRLVVLDTPGFDDTYVPDSEILNRIVLWLTDNYNSEMKLGGVIYLHEISSSRVLDTACKTLEEALQKLCGNDALQGVILGTTKWGNVSKKDGDMRTQQLCEHYWGDLLERGSKLYQFEDSTTSAWTMVDSIVEINRNRAQVLQIQGELDDALKLIPNTKTGRKLRGDLYQVFKKIQEDMKGDKKDESKRQELDLEIFRVREQMEVLQIPVFQHVLGFLSLGIDKVLDTVALSPLVSEPSVARPGIDCDLLVLLFGENREGKKTLLDLLSAEEYGLGNDQNSAAQDIKCWSVSRNEASIVIIDTPDFDLYTNPRQVVQKTRTWLETSCREDIKLGIIYLRGFDPTSSTGSCLADDIDHCSLQFSADDISAPAGGVPISAALSGVTSRSSDAGGPLEQSTPVDKANGAAAAPPANPKQIHSTSPRPAHESSVGPPLCTETTPFLPTTGSFTRDSLDTVSLSSQTFGPVKAERETPDPTTSVTPPNGSDNNKPVTSKPSDPPTARRPQPTAQLATKSPVGDGIPSASPDRVVKARPTAKRSASLPPQQTSWDPPRFIRSKGLQSTVSLVAPPAEISGSSGLSRPAMELFQGSPLAGSILFATLTTRPKTRRLQVNEPDSVPRYALDGNVVECQNTPDEAGTMLDIALKKALPLRMLLDDLTPLERNTNNKGSKFNIFRRFGRLFH